MSKNLNIFFFNSILSKRDILLRNIEKAKKNQSSDFLVHFLTVCVSFFSVIEFCSNIDYMTVHFVCLHLPANRAFYEFEKKRRKKTYFFKLKISFSNLSPCVFQALDCTFLCVFFFIRTFNLKILCFKFCIIFF